MNIYEELQWRGLIADCTSSDNLDLLVEGGRVADDAPGLWHRKGITLYCGFDPTADSLHVGNLVPLLALRRFQLFGHHPIALAGGATGSIGDPSGKTAERQLLTKEILDHNIASVKVQLAKLLDFETQQNPARLLDNATWTTPVSYLEFLRDIGKHFSVNQMVAKESVRARMEDREVGISYTEFSYMLLQAFDFYVFCRDYNCELQIGGSDQWGNITAGIELTRKKLGRAVYGLTLPLITNTDGSKFGKTATGAIWLDPKKTSKRDFFQFWMRVEDADVGRFLRFFTFLSKEEIQEIEKTHEGCPEQRVAQRELAQAVTTLVHGEETALEELNSVDAYSGKITGTKLIGLFPSKEMPQQLFDEGVLLVDLLVTAGISATKSQARRDIEGKGIYMNGSQVLDTKLRVTIRDVQFQKFVHLQKGRRTHMLILPV